MTQVTSERERRETKVKKTLELKEYIDNQTIVVRDIYLKHLENANYQEDSKTKKARKIYDTMKSLKMTINEEEFLISIQWFDDFNGTILVNDLDIDSQNFCLVFMTFFNSLTYRIMAALQDYHPCSWRLNDFWKIRVQLQISSFEIFGYNSNK